MDFAFSEEQEFLRDTARKWLADRSPSPVVRELMETDDGFDRSQWVETAELGWQAMAIPEEYGGAGFGFLELAVILEEMGRSLFGAPFLSTVVLAANAVLLAGSEEQKQRWLPAIAAGELVATVALPDGAGPFVADSATVSATPDGDGWSLSGTLAHVLDGGSAELLVVPAAVDGQLGLFAVAAGSDGLGTEALDTIDPTRKLATVSLDGVAAERIGDDAVDVLAEVHRIGSVALALEQVGGASHVLDVTVQYAKDREQFGRPIGSFQAIKHMCADMYVGVESARAAAYYAAWAVSESSDEVATVAPLAKAYCSEAYFRAAGDSIQVFGGIGFTWEHDAHLYFKRAKSGEILLGSPSEHRAVLAGLVGL